MSVRVADRGESKVQFLHNAMLIEVETLRRCEKIPNRYSLTYANNLIRHSIDGYDSLKKANSIYLNCKADVAARKALIDAARASYQCLISQVSVGQTLFPQLFSGNGVADWMALIETQERLLIGLKESDKTRLDSLPD